MEGNILSLGVLLFACLASIGSIYYRIAARQEKGTLFIFLEAPGLAQPDFNGFPTNLWLHFNTVAIIVQMQSPDGVSSIEGELRDWKETEALIKAIEPSLKIERWLGVYFGRTATCPMAKCNAESPIYCGEASLNVSFSYEECLAGMQGYLSKYDGYGIKGLIYDDEVGDPFKIVPAMETMAGKYKLAWSAGLSATRFERPRRMDGNGTWSYTLGQAYTNVHTTTYYETSGCKPRLDFWEQVEATMRIPEDTDYWREKMVPLVCGGGNCQEPRDVDNEGYCIDERLSKERIEILLQKRPASFKFKNFGIWYGGVEPTAWRSGPYVCYFPETIDWASECVSCANAQTCMSYH